VLVATIPAAPVLGLMTLGIVIAIAGHTAKNSRVAAIGLAILFLATALMMAGGFSAFQGDETDPRPVKDPRDAGF
jgi:hypothetical protein